MSKRVVVTGLGIISGQGLGVKVFWEGLLSGRDSFSSITGLDVDRAPLKAKLGAQVPEYTPLAYFSPEEIPLLDRHTQFALIAAREAVEDSGLGAADLKDAGIVLGVGCGGKETDEQTYESLYRQGKSRVHPLTIPRGMPSAAVGQMSIKLGISGPAFSVASACASSNHAVIQSQMMVRSGMAEVVLTGGADAPFTYGLLKAWDAMRVLSDDSCRPFSADRSGLVLGEGAGVLVLESLEHVRRRGGRIYAELIGSGMSSDAHHITAPNVNGAARAMQAALKDGGINPEQVGYLNAHGTGTQLNDPLETEAIHLVFGDHAPNLAVSSTKSMHGHALGAAGAFELIATLLAMQKSQVPPTANFTEPGDRCDLDYVPNTARDCHFNVALSNSFAFGGLNAVVAIRSL